MQPEVKQFLEQHQISFILYEHPAVFSVDQADIYCKHIPGMHCKNLFLKEKESKQPNYYLVVMNAYKRLNINHLAKILKLKKLTFGSEEELLHYLKLTPGSVSPLGLINDQHHAVKLIIDQEVWDAKQVNFHPNINTASLEFTQEQFHHLINLFENQKNIVKLD
jgi:Ala-tRNA(Pro) deacylase